MSFRGIVRSGNCPSGNCRSGKCLRGTVRRGKVLRGKDRWGNVCRETVRIPHNTTMVEIVLLYFMSGKKFPLFENQSTQILIIFGHNILIYYYINSLTYWLIIYKYIRINTLQQLSLFIVLWLEIIWIYFMYVQFRVRVYSVNKVIFLYGRRVVYELKSFTWTSSLIHIQPDEKVDELALSHDISQHFNSLLF